MGAKKPALVGTHIVLCIPPYTGALCFYAYALCSVHLVEVHFNTRNTCNIANLHCNDVQCGASTLDGIVQWLADCGLHCGCQHELVDKAVKFIQPVDVKMAPQLNLAAVFSLVDLNALNKSDIVLEDQCHTRSEIHPTRRRENGSTVESCCCIHIG